MNFPFGDESLSARNMPEAIGTVTQGDIETIGAAIQVPWKSGDQMGPAKEPSENVASNLT